ncbi:hypothetical protein LDENG_00046720 [Lucifuga dentata]|nr:hypothetical protein LDENG_00046720 [Lucifuga dentata]
MLHQIQEAEKLSGTIVFSNGQAIASNTKEMDTTAPYRPADSSSAAASTPKDPWIQLGAKPKAPISSTPVQQLEPWITVGHHKRRICSSESSARTNRPNWSSSPLIQTSVPPVIQLENRFSILYDQEFPLLIAPCPPSSPASTLPAPSNHLNEGIIHLLGLTKAALFGLYPLAQLFGSPKEPLFRRDRHLFLRSSLPLF